MVNKESSIVEVVNNLSLLIRNDLEVLSGEQRHPGGHGADEMDDIIRDKTYSVRKLRRLRDKFENVVTGAYIKEE